MTKPRKSRAVLADSLTLNRKDFDCRGVSPVIAVILMVAITVVLAAVLYSIVYMFLIQPEPIEYGSLSFEEDNENPGRYFGVFQGSVELDEIEISVLDASNYQTLVLHPTEEIYKEIPGGLNFSYKDINANQKLDATDLLLINSGEPGDKIAIVKVSSGRTVATCTLK